MERVHKLAAIIVFAFLCLHFANHFVGLFGLDAHRQFLDAARLIYRYPPVEYGLLAALAVLVLTGLPLIWEIWTKPKDFVHQLQAASGLILSLFILGHVAWIAYGRYVAHNDTDFLFVAKALQGPQAGLAYGFYGAGVFALFLHFGCILHGIFKKTSKPLGYSLLVATAGLGGYVTWLLLAMYSGQLYAVPLN